MEVVLSKSLGKSGSGTYRSYTEGREVFVVSTFPGHKAVERCLNYHSFPEV